MVDVAVIEPAVDSNHYCQLINAVVTQIRERLLLFPSCWKVITPEASLRLLCTVEILTDPEFKSDNQGLYTVTESTVWSLCLKASFSLVITSRIAYM